MFDDCVMLTLLWCVCDEVCVCVLVVAVVVLVMADVVHGVDVVCVIDGAAGMLLLLLLLCCVDVVDVLVWRLLC